MRRRAALAAVALLALSGCTDDAEEPGSEPQASVLVPCPDQPDTPARGAELMPALSLDCPAGGTLDLGRAPGVPTLVNLWATWCAPCRAELPVLQQFAEDAGDRVRVLGVISKDGRPQAESFADDLGIGFPSAFDGEGELMAELGLNLLPFTYFLDADGGLVHTELGEVGSAEELRGLVAEHLGVQL
ncbi:Thiol-disulfide isomerase or thioredoxin [Blastococcus aurantiacus]|uniref:Thiol-disulfide isomerase or thioredoxin n=1 Tax=Blastococcus aurantiacus TaxID=1550231 RepID=A0A1G7MM61_9ACTN|nr:TlpA disulfide reductase family protein [Blastococcus aurantiacus]SDF62239.1 Thiol-disulfide isomerase or thioredoxin [Blastococcus aurantiacus]